MIALKELGLVRSMYWLLVNNGSAKASDLIELARSSRKAVKDKFGITLEPEVQFVGITL